MSVIAMLHQLTFQTATMSLSYSYGITWNGTLLDSTPIGVVTVT